VAGILYPEAEVAPDTIVMDLLAEDPRHLRDAEKLLILVEDRVH
jgi:hypothetical protein